MNLYVLKMFLEVISHVHPSLSEKKIKVGDMVRVKETVIFPKYKWGAINHSNTGVVLRISASGLECQVDFCQQTGWTGLVGEMEVVASAHPGIR